MLKTPGFIKNDHRTNQDYYIFSSMDKSYFDNFYEKQIIPREISLLKKSVDCLVNSFTNQNQLQYKR